MKIYLIVFLQGHSVVILRPHVLRKFDERFKMNLQAIIKLQISRLFKGINFGKIIFHSVSMFVIFLK